MRKVRVLLASIAILALSPALKATPAVVHAGGHIGTAMTDFSQVTPDTAILYATIQSTGTDQVANAERIARLFTAQSSIRDLAQQALGNSNTSAGSQILTQVLKNLSKLFNGELGLSVLPLTYSDGPDGRPMPHLHLLLDAGLQAGITADTLRGAIALLGITSTPQSSYRNLSIVSVDLNALAAMTGAGSGMALPANGPISGVVYSAVAGNDAVMASDLPTLKRAIDTYFGLKPSIVARPAFQSTVGSLPAARLLTLYYHIDTEMLRPLLRSLDTRNATINTLPKGPGMLSGALSVSAEADGILFNVSPSVSMGSLAPAYGLSGTANADAAILPHNTIAYATLNDIGALIRQAILAAAAAARQLVASGQTTLSSTGLTAAQLADPIGAFNQVSGLNLDDDILSWMHGEASIGLLPTGSRAFGSSEPFTSLSLVATLTETDQAFVQAKLEKIGAALTRLAGSSAGNSLQLVDVPGPSGNPLHVLAATPGGIGYTFYQGRLVLASALPADMVGLQQAVAGHSLAANPRYQAALSHFTGPFGSALFVNLSSVRTTIERIAQESGTDMAAYNRTARPFLVPFKSFSEAIYPGIGGGGAVFIGISR